MGKKMTISIAAALMFAAGAALTDTDVARKGLGIKKTGLIPRYPADFTCPPVTSFYASWDDIDGTKRDEPHSGIDAGRLGDQIIAPAAGVVVAAWKANWGWGEEGALLLQHTREDLGLETGPPFYYSEFDHLQYGEIRMLSENTPIKRGMPLATVSRPGGKRKYFPEVHLEVWQVEDYDAIKWRINQFGGRYWTNKTANLVDPLYMLALNAPSNDDGSVDISIFDPEYDYRSFRGFTYIFPCRRKDVAK
jgi:murein DD-endopeptidase MepM/ murein hydrolase activator NlpD